MGYCTIALAVPMDLLNLEVHVFVILEVNVEDKDKGRINGDLETLNLRE